MARVQNCAQADYLFTNYSYLSKAVVAFTKWVECSPMVRENGGQTQVESYQRLKNATWYRLA